MVIWIAPWCGTYLGDMLMRQVHYDAPALFDGSGVYWYYRGWNWRAIGALTLAIGGALLFATLYQGPLIGPIGNSGISSEAERTAP